MHTLSKMTTEELVQILCGEGGDAFKSQHALDIVIELLEKRMTPEQWEKLHEEMEA
jgi:hypothetical protein